MPKVTFIQRGRFGRTIFTLRDASLEVSGYTLFGRSEDEYFLGTISPDYDRVGPRLATFVVIPLIIAAIFGSLVVVIYSQDTLPSAFFGQYAIMFCGMFLWTAWRHSGRLDTYVFFDRSRIRQFVILREKGEADECDDFVRELLDRIERVQQGRPLANDTTEVVTLRPSPIYYNRPTRSASTREVLWAAALAAGSAGAAFPPVSDAFPFVEPYGFAVVYGSLVAAMVASAYSFTNQERLKYLSIVGVALAATPLFLY